MSHQGNNGWFPECLVCGMGNVGAVVCLDPTCHEIYEAQGFQPLADTGEKLIEEDGHWWQYCQLCDHRIRADGGAWGTYALCVGCFNTFARGAVLPPSSPSELLRYVQTGTVFWEQIPNGKKLVVSFVPNEPNA